MALALAVAVALALALLASALAVALARKLNRALARRRLGIETLNRSGAGGCAGDAPLGWKMEGVSPVGKATTRRAAPDSICIRNRAPRTRTSRRNEEGTARDDPDEVGHTKRNGALIKAARHETP